MHIIAPILSLLICFLAVIILLKFVHKTSRQYVIFTSIALVCTVISAYLFIHSFDLKKKNISLGSKEIIIGIVDSTAPFIFQNTNGDLEGLDILIIQEYAKENNLKIIWKTIMQKQIIEELTSYNVDIVVGAQVINSLQNERITYTDPILSSPLVLFSRASMLTVLGSQNQITEENNTNNVNKNMANTEAKIEENNTNNVSKNVANTEAKIEENNTNNVSKNVANTEAKIEENNVSNVNILNDDNKELVLQKVLKVNKIAVLDNFYKQNPSYSISGVNVEFTDCKDIKYLMDQLYQDKFYFAIVSKILFDYYVARDPSQFEIVKPLNDQEIQYGFVLREGENSLRDSLNISIQKLKDNQKLQNYLKSL